MLDVQLQLADRTYRAHRRDLAAWVGCFALVTDRRLVGIFSSRAAASAAREALSEPDGGMIREIDATDETNVPRDDASSRCMTIGYPVYQMPLGHRYAA